MMDPNALKGNDRVGLVKLNNDFSLLLIASEDFPLVVDVLKSQGRSQGWTVDTLDKFQGPPSTEGMGIR